MKGLLLTIFVSISLLAPVVQAADNPSATIRQVGEKSIKVDLLLPVLPDSEDYRDFLLFHNVVYKKEGLKILAEAPKFLYLKLPIIQKKSVTIEVVLGDKAKITRGYEMIGELKLPKIKEIAPAPEAIKVKGILYDLLEIPDYKQSVDYYNWFVDHGFESSDQDLKVLKRSSLGKFYLVPKNNTETVAIFTDKESERLFLEGYGLIQNDDDLSTVQLQSDESKGRKK